MIFTSRYLQIVVMVEIALQLLKLHKIGRFEINRVGREILNLYALRVPNQD